jgi:hypothetical protein
MASEKARFAQEVAEVERWWKVCIDVHLQSLFTNLLYLLEPAICPSYTPIYRC